MRFFLALSLFIKIQQSNDFIGKLYQTIPKTEISQVYYLNNHHRNYVISF